MSHKFYEGIEVGKRYDEYSDAELSILPPIPNVVRGVDYPNYYSKPPLYWSGYKWVLDFE